MIRSIGVFTLFLVLTALSLHAQEGPEDEEGRNRLENLRRIKLIEALNLNEEQSVRLMTREKDFREKERQMQERRRSMMNTLESKLDEKVTDDILREQLLRMHEIGVEMQNSRRDYLLSLTDILSMQQITRMVIFEVRFAEEVRRLIQRSRKGQRSGR